METSSYGRVHWERQLADLFEDIELAAHGSRTHFARSMRTAAAKHEEIVMGSPVATAKHG